MSSFANNSSAGPRRPVIPETRTGPEGSSKRNIVRKRTGSGGSSKSNKSKLIDDGSLYQDPCALDENDPNYDSEEDTGREYVPGTSPVRCNYDPELRKAVTLAAMPLPEYKKKVESAIEEYFESGDIDEIQRLVLELECPEFSYELVKRAVSMALDRSDRERELVSQLLSTSYPDILSTNMIGKGFERLLELVSELEKDVPSARDRIATFIARAVVDEVIPPSFLSDVVVRNLGGDVVEHAKRMLSREHGSTLLERAWGPGDGRPVQDLKVAVDLLLREYILAGDITEASRCIQELNSAYFHHEIIKRGISLSLDQSADKQEAMSVLFAHLVSADIMSKDQCILGFKSTDEYASELCIDIPNARELIAKFKERAIAAGLLPNPRDGTDPNN